MSKLTQFYNLTAFHIDVQYLSSNTGLQPIYDIFEFTAYLHVQAGLIKMPHFKD